MDANSSSLEIPRCLPDWALLVSPLPIVNHHHMDETTQFRAHVIISWDQLARELGLQGRAIKVWSEDDQDYLHVILEASSDSGLGGAEGFHPAVPGAFIEERDLDSIRRVAQPVE